MVRIFRRRRAASGTGPEAAIEPSDASALPDASAAADAAELARVMQASTRKTRAGVLGRLGGVFRRGGVDEEFWEELEEILIAADVGVRTAASLIERVRQRARQDGARDPGAVREIMRAQMVALLERPAERGALWSATAAAEPAGPQVILVRGRQPGPARRPASPSWRTPTAPTAAP